MRRYDLTVSYDRFMGIFSCDSFMWAFHVVILRLRYQRHASTAVGLKKTTVCWQLTGVKVLVFLLIAHSMNTVANA